VKFLSVCSGIEAASVAWTPLGWQALAFAEIEKFPCAVLAHHYPETPNWGDLTKWQGWPDATVDVLVGGTPCQSFSVAGLRQGLADPRGGLLYSYLAVAGKYRPRWVVWENVPGVLSSDGGRDFGALLGGLAELGYGFAYRVLDAQYFGLAQRRARVFVVGHLGDWRRAAAVLFERASLSGHPAPRRSEGEGDGWVFPCITRRGQGSLREEEGYVIEPCGGVRHLSPRELERLQGFPDDYTLIPYRGKPAADGPRYKALGNSMAVPVMAWIGQRIAQVDSIQIKEVA